jgi:hypothetical protein
MMEEQYLEISKEQSKTLNRHGFRTFSKTSIINGKDKIVAYLINLSDILSYLERQNDLLDNIRKRYKKLNSIDREIKELNDLIKKKKSEIISLDKEKESV